MSATFEVLRKATGLTQPDLAQITGYSARTIIRREKAGGDKELLGVVGRVRDVVVGEARKIVDANVPALPTYEKDDWDRPPAGDPFGGLPLGAYMSMLSLVALSSPSTVFVHFDRNEYAKWLGDNGDTWHRRQEWAEYKAAHL